MGAARRQDTVLAPGLALLGLLALLPVQTRAEECEIALSVDAASSLLVLGSGAAGASLVAQPSTALGLQGGCAVLLAAACPGDVDSLVGSLVGAVLEASPGDPLELFPSSIQVPPFGQMATAHGQLLPRCWHPLVHARDTNNLCLPLAPTPTRRPE